MAYKVIILYRLYMLSYFLGTFTEYPYKNVFRIEIRKPIYGFLRFLLLVLRFLHRNLTFFMWET